ncbi:HamA C-terminal domain-containing protein [Halalkalibacter akibai]|uniref:Anti-bacteriophage protein A/HamA C-terminal domain-containing protein n=1 Tax=Halalkalibacter akibai (strain ATCC 43226 / DSM 21942 / CIP 109018 / JCM 9157 / 1139) TaxID=1236973 RepID=W4QX37_HALA3|nr:DUF1837 domain-containing protein [Halalkalibacter akibai]GAE36700.1 hypothetical protein JCM9157_3913 [Halalkalibacter akibai JCM 9157]
MTTDAPIFESDLIFDQFIEEIQFRAFSVGYEFEEFRYEALVDLIFSALLDFALPASEQTITAINAQRKLRRAAKTVYATEKYGKRGEFGEILLHIVMRDYFGSVPAISKMYYKDGPNETVKGFDAVHIVPRDNDLELWLGEVKFYNNIRNAIRDVLPELHAHVDKVYLRNEFLFINNKIDDSWEYSDRLKRLIDERTSLDKIFSRIKIPVLLTYDSKVVRSFSQACEEYKKHLISELNEYHDVFRGNELPNVDIVLILIPFEDKKKLVDKLHEKLRILQLI